MALFCVIWQIMFDQDLLAAFMFHHRLLYESPFQLIHLLNTIIRLSLTKHNVFFFSLLKPKLTMARCRRNVDNFLDACRKIGVDEVRIRLSLDSILAFRKIFALWISPKNHIVIHVILFVSSNCFIQFSCFLSNFHFSFSLKSNSE